MRCLRHRADRPALQGAVREKVVFVEVPNKFVSEQWEEHLSEIISYFYSAFGADKRLTYIFQES